ncbi:MafI family immunity protein [Pseudoalteromonas sp. MM17-2]|uniref:MafI family immunity protein n=1 Tax=Pseudoalteromonas sp. MM17-2 TaxID=2917753 RepID=UPI001EF5B186|nr:MafI family immunity protein [Pseudoalteromonas sp. MM17-2]MCG7545744.1 MafI family immunity protein [Pseudoalteromonas sp. MM17-2]
MREELLKLLELCKQSFTADETEEVMEFIEVNENKLALETICAIFYEEGKTVTSTQLDAIKEIGKKTTISPTKWERLQVEK